MTLKVAFNRKDKPDNFYVFTFHVDGDGKSFTNATAKLVASNGDCAGLDTAELTVANFKIIDDEEGLT